MADQTRQSFKWSKVTYTLKEIEEQYGNKLPQIILVSDGYSSSNALHTISSDEVYFIKSIAKQPRLVVADETGRLLSIPLDYGLKFNVVRNLQSGGISLGPSRKLREILHHNPLNTIKQLRLEMNQSVSILKGPDDTESAVLGTMNVHDIYHERYYLAHSLFSDAQMHPYQVEFPVYIPVKVRLAVGLTMADDKKMADVFSRAMELVTLDPDSEEAFDICFNPEIMLFEERDDDGYEYVNPGRILDWAVKVDRELKTVERVYDARKTVHTRRLMKEQQNWRRRQDSNPELLDIGVPTPRPRKPQTNVKPHAPISDPFVREVIGRPESPPPLLHRRGQQSLLDNGRPPPKVPFLKDKGKTSVESSTENDDHRVFKRRPSIEHDISPNYSSVRLLDFPLVDDADDHPGHPAPDPPASPVIHQRLPSIEKTDKSTEKSHKGHENLELKLSFSHDRSCPDGGNEVGPSRAEEQKMALKSCHIAQWRDVPDDISTLTVGGVNACLRLLNIKMEVEDLDGKLLLKLNEEDLKDFYQISSLEAKKIINFSRGWRPKF